VTEQDERTIYEWAYPELAELARWELRKSQGLPPTAMWNQRHNAKILRHLDHNFAFDVCVPKLRSEGIIAWFDGSDWFLDMVGTKDVWESTGFFDALLAYIKGKSHA
jgi:hypothetical protein